MPLESISGLGRTSNRDAGRTSSTRPEAAICPKTLAFFSCRLRSGEAGNPAASASLKTWCCLAEAFESAESIACSGSEDMGPQAERSGLVLPGSKPELFRFLFA
jgi:hypothetical protein